MRQILVGEEVAKVKALGEMARRVVEEGGSSYSDLNALIEELKLHCPWSMVIKIAIVTLVIKIANITLLIYI